MATLDLFKKITIDGKNALVVRSDAIEVFPTANRGINHETNTPINLESRLQTEYNLTNISDSNKTYIDEIGNFSGGANSFISFYIEGYHFKINGISESLLRAKLTPIQGYHITAKIKFKNINITTDQETKILDSFKVVSNEVTGNVADNCLDTDDGYFYGLVLVLESSISILNTTLKLFEAAYIPDLQELRYKVSQENWLPNIKAMDIMPDYNINPKYHDSTKPNGISINGNTAGEYALAEGFATRAAGKYSHAEGAYTIATGEAAHAEGSSYIPDNGEVISTSATGVASHAEGFATSAQGNYAHAEGDYTKALGNSSHASGSFTIAFGNRSYTEGSGSGNTEPKIGFGERVGESTSPYTYKYTWKMADVIEGRVLRAITFDINDHEFESYLLITNIDDTNEEISFNIINGAIGGTLVDANLVLGITTTEAAHSEGAATTASGYAAHAEGSDTVASNVSAHAEGANTIASGQTAHAEGAFTKASGDYSHAEGRDTTTYGPASHAEGNSTTAIGEASHAEGYNTQILNFETELGHTITFTKADPSPADLKYILIGIDGVEFTDWVSADYLAANFGFQAGTILTREGVNKFSVSCIVGEDELSSWASSHEESDLPPNYFIISEYSQFITLYPYNELEPRANELAYTICETFTNHTEGYNNITSGTANHIEGADIDANGNYLHVEGYNNIIESKFNDNIHTIKFRKVSSNPADREYFIYQIDNFYIGTRSITESGVSDRLAYIKKLFNITSGSTIYNNTNSWIMSDLKDQCFDNGTPTLSSDDYYRIVFTVDITDVDFAIEYPYDEDEDNYYEISTKNPSSYIVSNTHIEGRSNKITQNIKSNLAFCCQLKKNSYYADQWQLEGINSLFIDTINLLTSKYTCYIYNERLQMSSFCSFSYNSRLSINIYPKEFLDKFEDGDFCSIYYTENNTSKALESNHIEGKNNIITFGKNNHIEGLNNNNIKEEKIYSGYLANILYNSGDRYLYLLIDKENTEVNVPQYLDIGDSIYIESTNEKISVTKMAGTEFSSYPTIFGPLGKPATVSEQTNLTEYLSKFPTNIPSVDVRSQNWVVAMKENGTPCEVKIGHSPLNNIFGSYNHIEGYRNNAIGTYGTHIEGANNIATNDYQHIFGKYNAPIEDAVEIVGSGDVGNRYNIRTLDWNGNETIAGTLYGNTSWASGKRQDIQNSWPTFSSEFTSRRILHTDSYTHPISGSTYYGSRLNFEDESYNMWPGRHYYVAIKVDGYGQEGYYNAWYYCGVMQLPNIQYRSSARTMSPVFCAHSDSDKQTLFYLAIEIASQVPGGYGINIYRVGDGARLDGQIYFKEIR